MSVDLSPVEVCLLPDCESGHRVGFCVAIHGTGPVEGVIEGTEPGAVNAVLYLDRDGTSTGHVTIEPPIDPKGFESDDSGWNLAHDPDQAEAIGMSLIAAAYRVRRHLADPVPAEPPAAAALPAGSVPCVPGCRQVDRRADELVDIYATHTCEILIAQTETYRVMVCRTATLNTAYRAEVEVALLEKSAGFSAADAAAVAVHMGHAVEHIAILREQGVDVDGER